MTQLIIVSQCCNQHSNLYLYNAFLVSHCHVLLLRQHLLNTHLQPIDFLPLHSGTRSHVWFCCKVSISFVMASLHSQTGFPQASSKLIALFCYFGHISILMFDHVTITCTSLLDSSNALISWVVGWPFPMLFSLTEFAFLCHQDLTVVMLTIFRFFHFATPFYLWYIPIGVLPSNCCLFRKFENSLEATYPLAYLLLN